MSTQQSVSEQTAVSSRLTRLLGAMRRQRLVFVSIFALTVLKVYVAQAVITEMYEARAAILVPTDQQSGKTTSEIQILHSRQLLGEVVDALGPGIFTLPDSSGERLFDRLQLAARRGVVRAGDFYNEALIALDLSERLSERERALANLERHLKVESHSGTDVIALRLQMPSAALAVKVQQTLLDRYQTRRAQVRQGARPTAPSETEIARLRDSLSRAEDDLTRAQQAAVLAGRAINGPDATASLIAELEERRRRIEQNYLISLKRQNAATSDHTFDIRPITVLAAPAASLEPVYPRKLIVMVIALAIGLVFGLAAAAAREWSDDAVRDGLTLERATGLVCFGSFVDLRTASARR